MDLWMVVVQLAHVMPAILSFAVWGVPMSFPATLGRDIVPWGHRLFALRT